MRRMRSQPDPAAVMTRYPCQWLDAVFDYVLAFNVIYHGDRPIVERTIAEIARVLKAGGLYQGTMLSKRNTRYGCGLEVCPGHVCSRKRQRQGSPAFLLFGAGARCPFPGFRASGAEGQRARQARLLALAHWWPSGLSPGFSGCPILHRRILRSGDLLPHSCLNLAMRVQPVGARFERCG